MKYQSFAINIINLLGALYLISIKSFLILISKLVPDSKYVYPAAGYVITGNLKIISDSRIRSIIAKGPKYRFLVQIDFQMQNLLMNFVIVDVSDNILSVML